MLHGMWTQLGVIYQFLTSKTLVSLHFFKLMFITVSEENGYRVYQL